MSRSRNILLVHKYVIYEANSRSTTVGETCSPTRESRHEGHATAHDYKNGTSTFEMWEDNWRVWREGPKTGEAYKKVANEGKRVRIFAIRTKTKESSEERVPEKKP